MPPFRSSPTQNLAYDPEAFAERSVRDCAIRRPSSNLLLIINLKRKPIHRLKESTGQVSQRASRYVSRGIYVPAQPYDGWN